MIIYNYYFEIIFHTIQNIHYADGAIASSLIGVCFEHTPLEKLLLKRKTECQ